MGLLHQLQALTLVPTPVGGPSIATPEEQASASWIGRVVTPNSSPEEQRFIASIETPLRGRLPEATAKIVVEYSSPCENALLSDLIDIDSNKLDKTLKQRCIQVLAGNPQFLTVETLTKINGILREQKIANPQLVYDTVHRDLVVVIAAASGCYNNPQYQFQGLQDRIKEAACDLEQGQRCRTLEEARDFYCLHMKPQVFTQIMEDLGVKILGIDRAYGDRRVFD